MSQERPAGCLPDPLETSNVDAQSTVARTSAEKGLQTNGFVRAVTIVSTTLNVRRNGVMVTPPTNVGTDDLYKRRTACS
ncbi:hypothetical protein [Arthrobacter mobilis]|uniref:Uncharacterized protein n=1 Tax=Arthrobacter mobilis TaxID=2724944 RepID=A0A7X6K811_9MICC|nr:hypothetical protein [Arthrobacter mobilis]NKX56875.1 hypothetical protein [Arthrobacter mobilis]